MDGELILNEHQAAALEELTKVLRDGGAANLYGEPGVGKTTVAGEFCDLSSQKRYSHVTFVKLSALAHPTNLAAAVEDSLEKNRNRAHLFVVIDDWDEARADDDAVVKLQMSLFRLLRRGPRTGFVLVSQKPISTFQRRTLLASRVILSEMRPIPLLSNTAPRESFLDQIRSDSPQGLEDRIYQTLTTAHDSSTTRDQPRAYRSEEGRKRLARGLLEVVSKVEGVRDATVEELALDGILEVEPGTRKCQVARWLTAVVSEAGSTSSQESASPNQSIEQALEALAWEEFLLHMAISHFWIKDELNSAGIDIEKNSPFLPLFLARTHQTPIEFATSLFRPSDLRRLAPEDKKDGSKEDVLRCLYESWRTSSTTDGMMS